MKSDLRERTKDFALRVVRMFSSLPKATDAQVLGKQALRSGTSVGANYREAFRARSKAEWSERAASDMDGSAAAGLRKRVGRRAHQFVSKCGDCLREIEETAYWLELLVEARIVSAAKLQPLRTECDELTAIFVSIIKTSRS